MKALSIEANTASVRQRPAKEGIEGTRKVLEIHEMGIDAQIRGE
jgi:hypothetical protein